jgi:hypothetical protein
MFCPNCGQQQIADSTKFCPRCGTQLAGLAEWLAGGGANFVAREAPAPTSPPAPLSPRRKGMRRGAKVMFLSGVLLPFVIAMSAAAENPGPFIFALVIFFIGFSMMLYARLFGEDTPRAVAGPARPQVPVAAANATALPPAADTRINNFARRGVRTAELAQPPSVTEHTTRLLDDE